MVPQSLQSLFCQHTADQFMQVTDTLAALEFDALLISAGEVLHPFRDDVDYPFMVNPYFRAWLPLLDRPGCYVWISSKLAKPVLFYHQPKDIWHQINPLQDEAVLAAFDVKVIASQREMQRQLSRDLDIAFIGVTDDCPDLPTDINPPALLSAIDFHRAQKSAYEVACIRLANEKAIHGHVAAETAFRSGGSEYDIHMAYLMATSQLDEDLPYGNIIALNEHSAVLHYTQKLRQAPGQSRSFLIDAGATIGGYASDISRTYATPGSEFDQMIDAVDEMQLRVIEQIKVGDSYLDLHLKTHQLLASLLKQFDLVTGSEQQLIDNKITQLFFPHGLGHLLGLQVHERGGWMHTVDGSEVAPPEDHPYLRLTRPLATGQVFTIEPGLYFIDALLNPVREQEKGKLIHWGAVDKFKAYGGIRIEDNIYLGAEGCENLTRTAWQKFS
ncbi:MAG: Xaa-Pro dipeptidase [Cellvibrionaceae bacterium]